MNKKPINFPKNLNLSFHEKKLYNSNLKNFLKNKPLEFIKFFNKIKNHSMQTKERLFNLYDCLKYIEKNNIKGEIVEVGCYKGATLAFCRSFSKRKIYGFDTFEGHPEPDLDDKDIWGISQNKVYKKQIKDNGKWLKVGIDQVKKNISNLSTLNKVELIKGNIEDKILELQAIKKISILILDVQWFKANMVVLKNLFPKINKNGYLIISDYGHHSGTQKATNLYFKKYKKVKFYHIDYSCIIMQKTFF